MTACVRKKTVPNASFYNTNAMLSLFKPKPIVSLKSTKTEWLIFRERREWRPPRALGFSGTIPLAASKSLAQSETSETGGTIIPKEPDQFGKLQRVLADLKIACSSNSR